MFRGRALRERTPVAGEANSHILTARRLMRIHRLKQAGQHIRVISYALKRPREFARLSVTEIDVVEGVLMGLSQSAIAKRQNVTLRTVANQIASAYRKLGVDNVAELALMCSQRGTEPGEED